MAKSKKKRLKSGEHLLSNQKEIVSMINIRNNSNMLSKYSNSKKQQKKEKLKIIRKSNSSVSCQRTDLIYKRKKQLMLFFEESLYSEKRKQIWQKDEKIVTTATSKPTFTVVGRKCSDFLNNTKNIQSFYQICMMTIQLNFRLILIII